MQVVAVHGNSSGLPYTQGVTGSSPVPPMLRAEGYSGGYTAVKDAVRELRRTGQNEAIELRERSPRSVRNIKKTLDKDDMVIIPFALKPTHFMFARGTINDRQGMTFFVDSGLATEGASFAAPIQTLELLGIPEPETTLDANSAGGGGGAWASGGFTVESLGLGPLIQENLTGEYGSRTPASYWSRGFIEDALLSHDFLRNYATWTIDFDEMEFIFER